MIVKYWIYLFTDDIVNSLREVESKTQLINESVLSIKGTENLFCKLSLKISVLSMTYVV